MPGLSGTVMKPVVDNRLFNSFDERIPPGHVHGVILHGQKIIGGGDGMHSRHARHRRTCKVNSHAHAVFFRHVANVLGFENAARSARDQDG